MTAAVSTSVERPTSRELADLLRDLRDVRNLRTDDPRRQAWLERKRDLLERIASLRGTLTP